MSYYLLHAIKGNVFDEKNQMKVKYPLCCISSAVLDFLEFLKHFKDMLTRVCTYGMLRDISVCVYIVSCTVRINIFMSLKIYHLFMVKTSQNLTFQYFKI